MRKKKLLYVVLVLVLVFSGCIGPQSPQEQEDTAAPVIRLINPSNNSFITPGDVIEFSVNDENLSSVKISVDSSPYTEISAPFEVSTETWNEGNHTLSVLAQDSSGNTESAWFFFSIDLTAPRISLLFPANNSAMESTGIIQLSIEDANLLGANYTLDGGGPRILPAPYRIPVVWWPEGPHNISVYANDRAGNRAERSFHFIIDNRPTDIRIVSPEGRVIRPGVPIVFSLDEENLVDVVCKVNGIPVDFSTRAIDTGSWSDGTYFIEVNATDLAGHRTSRSYTFEVDSIPPAISSFFSDGDMVVMSAELDMKHNTFNRSGGNLEISAQDQHLEGVYASINGGPYVSITDDEDVDIYGWRGKTLNVSIKAMDSAGNTAYRNMTLYPTYTLWIRMGENTSEMCIPVVQEDTYIRTVFESINNSYSRVLTFVNGSWRSFNPAYPDKFNLDFLYVELYMGLVVEINRSSADFVVSGYLPETYTISLRQGSNFVPYISMRPMRLDSAFSDIPWYRVQRWDWETQSYVNMRGNETLLPGHAYWVYVSEDSILKFDF